MDTVINTITDFVKSLDAELRVFDMGRRLYRLSNKQFQTFENFETPYPTPLQRHAWLGILIWWKETKEEPLIWFLKLPLDEQGIIIPASRDDFIQRLMKAIQNRVHNPETRDQSILSESELAFTPNQERMAAFHAKISHFLNKNASSFYEPAISYLKKEQEVDSWDTIGLQGLADVCARLEDMNHEEVIKSSLKWLPETPKMLVLTLLENEIPSTDLSLTILDLARQELAQSTPNPTLLAAYLRAMSGSKAATPRQELIIEMLANDQVNNNLELISAIASRCWKDLENESLCFQLFECIAQMDSGEYIFIQFYSDLVAIPGVRPWLMAVIRSTERSEALSKCIGVLFNGIK
ncbi:DUF3549 family protein [Litoribacillus peritrichatus]|uniref:DUF3549 family protein n=1 Tax=Litoribacillus peritrichatus TaxID=718191 RepID=A0ABP7M0Q3_9GAMM